MAKKKKTGTCAYCGAENIALTIEHVFPESWYPDGATPSSMLTVPACSPCNGAYAKAETQMFLPLALMLPSEPRLATIVERAIRSADPSSGKSARDSGGRRARGNSILRSTRLVDPKAPVSTMWTPAGRQVGEFLTEMGETIAAVPVVSFDWKHCEEIAIKFLRGCYFAATGAVLGTTRPAWARNFLQDPSDIVAEWERMPGATAYGAFPFRYVLATDTEGRAGAAFVMWDFLTLFAANLPATRA